MLVEEIPNVAEETEDLGMIHRRSSRFSLLASLFSLTCFFHGNELRRQATAESFIQGINAELKQFDPSLYVASATAYGAFSNYNGSQTLIDSIFTHPVVNFSFKYLPVREPRCSDCRIERNASQDLDEEEGLSHVELKSDIYRDVDLEMQQVSNQRELSPILICTSDPDFELIIRRLKSLGFKVLLFANSDAEPSLLTSAHLCSTTLSF
ncbi:unnamed protein product [Microthlaspi erraticum]|uniref:NYN domain-containing protein n=1 Tax=Microthlaspi erraticum TaxID=1685480 RepID=A0A6D2IDW9_9BRAS|nr:unnamed protein product [Microthlaspi erraticum]